jgi:conjugative relaxase-like TrwC/TraI family protein
VPIGLVAVAPAGRRWHYLYGSTAAGYLYEGHLRQELTARLGVEWAPVKNGIADIEGIDEAVRDHFSDRAKEIQEHLDEVGFRSARAAEIATLDTRRAKHTTLTVAPRPDAGSDRNTA